MELRLRQSGIPVDDESSVSLVLDVSAFGNNGMYIYHTLVTLMQPVTVISNGVVGFAGTWFSDETTGTVGADNLRELREVVLEQVDEFSNDYLAVNPLL